MNGDPTIQEIGFILVPGFALMSFASASEPFRAANLIAGRDLYRIRVFGEADPVPSSSGMAAPAEPLPGRGSGLSMLFVCAGGGPRDWNRPEVHASLRRAATDGVRIGGISGGPYLLVAAGLMEGRRFTVHWEHAPALIEAFPTLRPEQARFVIDGNRLTCGGGVAPLDMMHALIAERMGAGFARRVADWYLHTEVSGAAGPQRASLSERFRVHHPVLVAVLEKMIGTIEAPLTRDAMARFAGVSPRHLDRLFAEHMGSSFGAQYRGIRLEQARRLVAQSPLSLAEIAFATGFSSAGHLSRRYLEAFGEPPGAARRARAGGGA
ncbi:MULTISPECIES: GlxA family transcriptional regulator [unclassified Aureimonas]|uniref:GlxA family transcriptional regulator n=1 Tax=unclassified Aureimonas TaxID=2615206 RepID=UPI0006F86BCD|nr:MULTISPECIES: GlxA family transcriptional regulator [unclassified Aureimonas]KQT64003.1 transcriptional regulator [Aureimonas sp. Leaf427]KQT81196.1 transcriptional regulator [Aureimonas sp. Leaf460]